MKHKTLYKLASSGAIQEWWMDADIDRYRTLHCVQGGEVVSSEWTYPEAKNVGKANERTVEEQVKEEIAAQYKKKLAQGKYCESSLMSDLLAAQESYFSPMLAEKLDPDRITGAFYVQPKFNGVRCVATKDGLWSRKGKEFVNTPHIYNALKDFFENYPDLILDGELYNHNYKDDFNNLVSAIKKLKPTPATQAEAAKVVQFYLYDIYDPNQPNLVFGERWNMLSALYATDLDRYSEFELSPTFRSSDLNTAKGLHQRNKDNGYEGSIIRLNERYENKRTYSLMKYKDMQDEEFEIAAIEEGKGNWSGHAKVVYIVLPGRPIRPGDLYLNRYIGMICKCKKGDHLDHMSVRVSKASVKGNKEYAKELLENRDKLIGKQATVVFFELTPDSVPLFPIFQIVRDYE